MAPPQSRPWGAVQSLKIVMGAINFVKKHNLAPVFMQRRKKQADVLEKCNTTFVILLPCDKLLELVSITQAILLDAGVDGDADLGGG